MVEEQHGSPKCFNKQPMDLDGGDAYLEQRTARGGVQDGNTVSPSKGMTDRTASFDAVVRLEWKAIMN